MAKSLNMNKNQSCRFKIREMTLQDYKNVISVWKKAGIHLSYSDTKPEFKRMLEHNPGLCLVLEDAEKRQIIGAVLGGFDGRRGWIHHLAIDPNYQRQGFGKMLMDELTRRFKDKKIVKIKLEIVRDNAEVIEFYKKLGWELREEIITMSLTLFKKEN